MGFYVIFDFNYRKEMLNHTFKRSMHEIWYCTSPEVGITNSVHVMHLSVDICVFLSQVSNKFQY